jgi:hypothetical protein
VRVIHWIVAYVAVGLSAGLAAWSGMQAATEPADAYIKGAIMFLVALLGCHGWGWAARTWADGHKRWAVVAGFVLTVSMLVTLIGGAGSFYSAANTKIATAERGSDAYNRADAELRKIDARRKKLTEHRSAGEIEPDITSAKADKRFKSTNGCAPDLITKSREFCIDFRKLETEKAAAEEAERLDKLAAPHLAIVGKGRPASAGGWGALIAAVTGMDVGTGNAVFSIMCTIALDLGAVVAILTAELRHGHTQPAPIKRQPQPQPKEGRVLDRLFSRRRQPEPEPIDVTPVNTIVLQPEPAPEPPRVPERPRPRLAISQRKPVGAVLDWLAQGISIANAVRTGMAEAVVAYQAWCSANNLQPLTVAEFFAEMKATCPRFRIRIVEDGGKHWLQNVQLKQSVHKLVN